MRKLILTSLCIASSVAANAQNDSLPAIGDQQLQEVQVVERRPGSVKSRGVVNAVTLTDREFTKAACCNLGESFTTNPSVDVNYSDAATGARQIRLLGLSGTYVQMLTENIPNFRCAALPYSLGYVPGPWMQSIQVSKGCASVKNGHESITGQINIEYLKPQLKDQLNANIYGNSMAKLEANADAMFHLTPATSPLRQANEANGWSMGVMMHYEDKFHQTDHNHDTFADSPDIQQWNAMMRWAFFSPNYIFQSAVRAIKEERAGGQMEHHAQAEPDLSDEQNEASHTDDFHYGGAYPRQQRYAINLSTQRYEAFAKNAYIFDHEHNGNVALILNATFQQMESLFGWKHYDVIQRDFYAQLLYETDFSPMHNLSAGLSYLHSSFDEWKWNTAFDSGSMKLWNRENTPGAYAQYTFNLDDKLILMAGLRADYSYIDHRSRGTFLTPRMHVKYAPNDVVSLRASIGKGHRFVRPLAENSFLLGSGRTLLFAYEGRNISMIPDYVVMSNQFPDIFLEEAWNSGFSLSLNIPLFKRTLQLNAEYYYTHFLSQVVADYDASTEHIYLVESHGKNRNHCFQIDASYPIVKGLELTAAYRRNIVRSTYGGMLQDKPLQSKYKGLLTASYKTPLGLWQIDATLQLNGSGRMPTPYSVEGQPAWNATFKAYEQVNLQLTRWFRHFSVYAGAENLTNFRQKNPIIHAHHPWTSQFDPTLVYGPVDGAMFYVGLRLHFERF